MVRILPVEIMFNIAVFSSTGGTNFQSLIDAKAEGKLKENVNLCCLLTNKETCGAVQKAQAVGIPIIFIDPAGKSRTEFDREAMQALEEFHPDLIVLGGYMRIIGEEMVAQFKNKIINVHPSLLPKFSGGMNMDVHKAVIEAGETQSGMTIHLVDEGVDTGAIVLQKSCPVLPEDTPDDLKNRVQSLEKEWYPEVVQWFADDRIKAKDGKVTLSE